MEIKYFALSTNDNSKAIRYIRIMFGIVCIVVAVFWLSFNIKSLKADGTLWITIIFLSGFGFYQILSGLGHAERFIETGPDRIRLKKNAFLPTLSFSAGEIEKIELFPMNVVFFLKSGKRILLRFGSTFQETNEKIKDELLVFAGLNNIEIEFIEEKI